MSVWPKRTFVNLVLCGVAFGIGYFGYTFNQDRQFVRAEEKREETRSALAHVESLATAFRQVGKVVEPSVVHIRVRKKISDLGGRRLPFDPEELRRFFRDKDGDVDPETPDAKPRAPKPRRAPDQEGEEEEFPDVYGQGSGVIMEFADGKGYILTNNHVAGGAEELIVTLSDGRTIKNGRVLGTDPKTDLAVIEVKSERLSPAKWGDSDELQKGDWIMAFGSPFGYVGSMTHGIVSALNRQADILVRDGYENFIQVDAPINPGNSGGPLVNLRGEVVGINTAIASQTGQFAGIGLAIPANQAQFVFSSLKNKGKVIRGWLGVGIDDVSNNPLIASWFGYPNVAGVLVEQIFEGTPALGRLNHGDFITELGGKPVKTVQELRSRIAALPPGSDVTMKVFRGEKEREVTIKLGEQPENMRQVVQPRNELLPREATPKKTELFGMTLQTMTAELAEERGLRQVAGTVITKLQRNSTAAKANLMPGDVIIEVNGKPVENVNQLAEAVDKADMKKGILLYVYFSRAGTQRYVVLAPEK